MTVLNLLDKLAAKYGTDKGTRPDEHQYTSIYYEMFQGKEIDVRNVLEIGIGAGGSLMMWRDYFPFAMVYGFEILPEHAKVDGDSTRIRCFNLDATKPDQIDNIMKSIGKTYEIDLGFDFIVDDASHVPDDQIITAQLLLPYLAQDGVYVIEDIGDHEGIIAKMVDAFKDYDLNLVQERWPDSRFLIIRHRKDDLICY
jgi:hypothetical protein